MSVKNLPVWVIFMFFALATLVGCSGGGSSTGSVVNTSTPEAAVYEILAAWQKSQTSVVSSASEGTLVEQETTSENYIRFRDMSGEEWLLRIDEVNYLSSTIARVFTSYLSVDASRGSLKLIFSMVKDQNAWFLDDIQVTEVPVVVINETGVSGVITDKSTGLPVSGAQVDIFDQSTGSRVNSMVTGETGYYSFVGLTPGTYYLVIEREGYEPQTISDIIIG